MTLLRRQFLHVAASAAALPALSRMACVQAYPTRRITFVNPAAAGGPIDVVARVIGDRMRVTLGQPIVVDNVTGGVIGVVRAARAAPDGYPSALAIGAHTLAAQRFILLCRTY
jgi:tripartite-type tricarboxylate transporter receptor subunit TctC